MLTNIILFWGFWVHFCENGTKMIKKRQVLQGFRQCISPVLQMLVFPMNSQVSQHHEITSWNAYKHNAFLMLLSAFLRIWLRNDQETTGFIRVWWLGFPVAQNISFPKGFQGFAASQKTCRGILINVMLFTTFEWPFAKVTMKWSRNNRVYKGFVTGFSSCSKH